MEFKSFDDIKTAIDGFKTLIEQFVNLIADFVASWKKTVKFE